MGWIAPNGQYHRVDRSHDEFLKSEYENGGKHVGPEMHELLTKRPDKLRGPAGVPSAPDYDRDKIDFMPHHDDMISRGWIRHAGGSNY